MIRLAISDRLRRRQETNTYRQVLMASLASDIGLQVLPALRTLPWVGLRNDGTAVSIDRPLLQQGVLLRGQPGSGRRLLIAQLAHAWLAGRVFEKPAPLPIDLSSLDDGSSSPNALLTGLVAELSRDTLRDELNWLLLVSGWEDLPAARRIVWRSALVARQHPTSIRLGLVVAPLEETAWPGLTTITLPQAGPGQAATWLKHLAPDLDPALLIPLLGPTPQLFDCALVAWLHTRGQIPSLQIEREQRALALFQTLRPTPAGSLAAISTGAMSFYTQRAALLGLAAQIVDTAAYQRVLTHPQRHVLALLVTGLATVSDGWFAILRAGSRDAQICLVAGRCLAERPPSSPVLILLLARGLAQLATAGRPESEHAGLLLAACLPALDRALDQVASRRAYFLIRSVLSALSAEDALPRLARLAYDPATDLRIGWWCASRLATQPNIVAAPAPQEQQSLARWAFVHALCGPAGHALLLRESPAQALRALAVAKPHYREPAAIALLTHPELPLLVRLSALTLLESGAHTAGAAVLPQLARDPIHAIRIAALKRLVQQNRRQGTRIAAEIASAALQPWETRYDAIQLLAGLPDRIAGPALIASAADPVLPLHVRIEALRSRSTMRQAQPQLFAVARNQQCDPIIRAAAVRLLAHRKPIPQSHQRLRRAWRGRRIQVRRNRLNSMLAWLLDDATTPGAVAIAAGDLLSARGGSLATVTLIGVIEHAPADIERTNAAIIGLGRLRGERVIHTLANLLGAGALMRLQQTMPAALVRIPAAQAIELSELPLMLRRSLQSALTTSLRVADRPTTVLEFLMTAADRLRSAAAHALAQIGGIGARSALINALISGESATATPALLDALLQVCDPDDAQPLMQLIANPRTTTRVRWLAAQRLADHPAALGLLLDGINRLEFDSLTRATLAAALGRRRAVVAHAPLATLAQDRTSDSYLREQALVGLGYLGNAASDMLLLRIAADPTEQPRLRGVAAAQISPAMDAATQWALRNLLHQERATVEVLIGGLNALGRTRDREALPLIMQYSQDQRSEVARVAIDALAAVNDSTITSVLVGLAHKPHLDRVLRLHAVGALLRLGDPDGPLLLRDYLHGSSVPLQMQALEQLIAAGASAAQLLLLASDQNRAVAFRLRALECVGTLEAAEPLCPILEDSGEPAEIRGRAAQILATIGGLKAHELLVFVAVRHEDHTGVRCCCIDALLQRRDQATAPTLAQIAADADQPFIAEHAASALLALMVS